MQAEAELVCSTGHCVIWDTEFSTTKEGASLVPESESESSITVTPPTAAVRDCYKVG